jgi:hypothetical protein
MIDGKSRAAPPSVVRYVRYVHHVVQRGLVLPPDRLLSLSHVVLSSPPDFDAVGGCEPVVKVCCREIGPGRGALTLMGRPLAMCMEDLY